MRGPIVFSRSERLLLVMSCLLLAHFETVETLERTQQPMTVWNSVMLISGIIVIVCALTLMVKLFRWWRE